MLVLSLGGLMLLKPLASANEITTARIAAAMLTLIRRGRWGRCSTCIRSTSDVLRLPFWVIGRMAARVKLRLRVAGGGGAVRGGAELAERAILDLAHALGGEADPLADLAE